MSPTITIPSHRAHEFVEVFEILEWREDAIYRAKPIGFARATRPIGPNERYAPLSTKLTRSATITLELLP